MYRALLVLVSLLGLPLAVLAADGEGCNTDVTQFTALTGGNIKPLWCITIVDDETSATDGGSPVVISLATVGLPDTISFLVGSDEDCSAGDITFSTGQTATGSRDGLSDPNPALDLNNTAGATRINVSIQHAPIGPFIATSWANVAGCTGGFDIIAIGYEINR